MLDLEPGGLEVLDRLTKEVIAREPDEDRVQEPLNEPHCPRRAAHMIEQQEASAGTQDATRFSNGSAWVRDGAHCERAHDRVERRVLERERLGVAEPEVHRSAERRGAPPGTLEHRGAHVDPGQAHIGCAEREVAPGADPDFEHIATRLAADLRAAVAEHEVLHPIELAVIAHGHPLVDALDTFGLAAGVSARRHVAQGTGRSR